MRAALRFGLSHRLGFTLTMVALLLLSAYSYRFLRQGFFPDMVYDQLYMEYKLPEGNNSTRVANDLKEIEAYLKNPEGDHERDSFHRWDAGTLQPGAKHCQSFAGLWGS